MNHEKIRNFQGLDTPKNGPQISGNVEKIRQNPQIVANFRKFAKFKSANFMSNIHNFYENRVQLAENIHKITFYLRLIKSKCINV